MHPATILLQTDAEAEAAAGIIALFGGTMFFAILVIWALTVVGMWRLFVKAGQPGWASIIPIYNVIVLGQIVG